MSKGDRDMDVDVDKEDRDRNRDNRDRERDNKDRERDNKDRERDRDKDSDRNRDRDRDRDRDRNRDRDRHRDRENDRDRNRGRDRDREREKDRERGDRHKEREEPVRENKKDQELEQKVKQAEQKERTTGVYIPPFKLAMMMKNVGDKESAEYQRMTWDALKKSINGLVNKVSTANIKNIVMELFRENLIRAKGLFCRSLMRAQHASPIFSNVYAALVAVVNTKLPENGELLLKRLVEQFKKAFRRNDKAMCLSTIRFIAHLSNQQVCGTVLPLEVILLLLDKPTDDSVEISVEFMKEAGQILTDLQPKVVNSVFDRFRSILHEGVSISDDQTAQADQIDKRVQYTIEGLMAIRQSSFRDFPGIPPELDIVDVENQVTHEDIRLEETYDVEDNTNYFVFDPNYAAHEAAYDKIKADILGEEDDESEGEGSGGEDGDESGSEEEGEGEVAGSSAAQQQAGGMAITDATDTNLINLRRTIYLSIMSSVDFEECAHKLLKVKLPEGQEMELCTMLLECCSQERTYLRFYGLLGQRFCMLNKIYQVLFDECFAKQYAMIHRLETNKLRNVAKFFAHLLHSDALPWTVLRNIHLNEEETTSSSRIFIKILFQEISEYLGLQKFNARLKDQFLQDSFAGLFPKDNPKNTRFAINFFTSIGLGGLTDDLREHLRQAPKAILNNDKAEVSSDSDSSSSDSDSSDSDSDSSSDSSDSSSDSSSSSSSSSSSDSDSGRRKRRRRS